MSAIALIGGLILFFSESTLKKLFLPLVAFSAGSLLGGTFFHMIPASIERTGLQLSGFIWVNVDFQ